MKFRHYLKQRFVPSDIAEAFDRMPVNVGELGYDPWGFNPDSAKLALTAIRFLYEKYFRVQAHGLEHIPQQGRLLVIANHSGQLPMDGVLIGYALATNPYGPRMARAMIERFFPTVPWIGNVLNQIGGIVGDPLNCVNLLKREEAVIVFPEGVRGSGKPYRLRYQLQRFGAGFMHLAMEQDTPIVPVGVVGCEETMPSLGSIDPLAKLLGIPYVPIAPLVPLPARVILNFGEPMRFAGPVESEEQVVENVEQVKDEIRRLIDKGLAERKGVFR
ncbi:MAG TPA: lysophospholipid acyltransferase family protein [Nevskiales bacterium]|nr:lysophospholipid acyltransferase family protein [Nevskiales bacterium]